MIKITKRQEIVNDQPGKIWFTISEDDSGLWMGFRPIEFRDSDLLELYEKLKAMFEK